MRYCKGFSAGNRGSLLYRRNRRSAWRSDRFVDPAESNNRSANRNVDDLDQSSTDGGILDSVRTIKNSKTVKTVLICNAIIDLAVTPYLPVYTGNRFMACIIGGALVGIGMAIVFMSGSTTGGSDIGAKLIQKYFPHIQTGTALMVLDLIIIGTSILMFRNVESGLYGMISMVVTSYVIDMTLYGLNRSTMITDVTQFSDKIADVLMEYLDRGCTLLECRGAYSKKASGVTLCVVDRKQMYKAKKLIYQIDPKAFLIVSEAREVYGEGFLASDQE